MTELRRGLPPLPKRFVKLPIDHRGYPVPWFVTWIDGKPDFRVSNAEKRVQAANKRLCWLCGEPVGRYLAFVIGPMCAVNRNTSEPGCHRDCAEFAVQACPFMILPDAQYRTAHLPADGQQLPHGLPGNPGAACIWITETFKPYRVEDSWLIRVGPPVETLWYAMGKPATRQQILDCFDARLHFLSDIAKEQGPEAESALAAMVANTMRLLPADTPTQARADG